MKKILTLITVFFTAIIFNSCDSDESLQMDLSRVNFINATPDMATGNSGFFYIDGTLLNTAGLSYKSARGYNSIQSGARTLVGGYGTSSTTTFTQLFSNATTLSANESYSVFMTSLVGRSTTTPAYTTTSEAIVVQDNLVSPSAGTFKIRLANMLSVTSGAATTISLVIKSVDSSTTPATETTVAIIPSVAAKSASAFIEVPLTTNGYKFEIQKSSDSSVFIAASSSATTLIPGRIYTIMASGFEVLPTGTGAPTNGKSTTVITNL